MSSLYIFTIAVCRKVQDSLSPRNTSSQKSSRSSRSPGRKASSARNSSRNEDNLILGSESSDIGQNKRRQSSEAEVKGLLLLPLIIYRVGGYIWDKFDTEDIVIKQSSILEALFISDPASMSLNLFLVPLDIWSLQITKSLCPNLCICI